MNTFFDIIRGSSGGTYNYWQFNKILYVFVHTFIRERKEFRFSVQETFNKVRNMNGFDPSYMLKNW